MSLYSRLDRIAADVEKLNRQVTAVANAPQSQRTSVEGGSIDFNDADGNLKAIVGMQDDGGYTTNVISGPTPPTPANFTVEVDHGKIVVHWDGTFENALVAPTDWARAEVYAQEGQFVTPSRELARGSMVAASGGEVTIGVLKGQWTVCMAGWSQAGIMSPMSAPVTVDVPGYGDIVLAEIDAAETVIKNAGEVLVTEQGTLDEKLTEVDGTLDDLGQDIVAVEDAQAQLNTDLTDVMTSVDGKNTITWNPSAPSAVSTPGKAVGDMWYRTSGNSIIGFWKWDGTDWITQLLDKTTIPLIDIGAGTFGNLAGARLTAGSIGAEKLYIGVPGNLVVDPTFEQGTSGRTIGAHTLVTEGGVRKFRADAANSQFSAWGLNGVSIPAVEGQVYRFECEFDATGGGGVRVFGSVRNGLGTVISAIGSPTVTGSGKFVWETVMPAAGASVSCSFRASQAGVKIWLPTAYQIAGATTIQDGVVSTQKLTADVLEVKNLKATSGQLDEAVINKLFSDVVVAKTAVANAFIGENAILTGAVTAPKITASEELWAKIAQFVKIRAEHIEADAIDGMVITGATYRTSGGNGSWSDAGLFIRQPDGTSMVRFPTDGSPLSLTASDTQIDRATIGDLDVTNGAVRSGGTFNLASGVTPPPSPPELTTAWSKFATLAPSSGRNYPPHAWESLGYWAAGNAWVRSVNIFGASSSEPDKVEILDYATGSFIRSFNIELNPTNNLTIIGDIVYLLGDVYSSSGVKSTWIYGYNLNTGVRTSRHEYTRSVQSKNALGNDGTNLIIGSVYNLELWVHRRDPVTGVQVGSDLRSGPNSWPSSGGTALYGVRISGVDVEVVTAWGGRAYLNSNNALVRKTDTANASGYAGWVLPAHDVAGCVWVGGVPYPVDSGGSVYRGSSFGSDTTVQTCFTWYSGGYETTPSMVAGVLVGSRESATISVPTRTGLQKRVYYRAGSSGSWNRAELAESVTALTVSSVPVGTYQPPASNTFPNADPAVFRSTNGNVVVRGDGSGKWGPLTFNADGTMSSSQIPAWVPVTTFESGFSAQTWGDVPSYRVWPDGKVEWRGVIAGPIPAGTGVPILTIPSAALPGRPKNKVGATSTGGTANGVARLEFGPQVAPTKLYVFGGTDARNWASVDEIYYYLS